MTILSAGGPLGTAETHGVEGALLVALIVAAGALLLALSAILADRQRTCGSSTLWLMLGMPLREAVEAWPASVTCPLQKTALEENNPLHLSVPSLHPGNL